jgi:hypothetical protein
MSVRLVSAFVILLAIPMASQTSTISSQVSQHVWARGQMMRPDSAPEIDPAAARLEAIHQDAADLSALSTSLQFDLQQLQKGLLAKDLQEKLKKLEKLSKRLRQEMAP